MARQRHGGDHRGSSADRRARKMWLLSPGAGHDYGQGFVLFGGDGAKVPCVHCRRVLDYGTVEADRVTPGGSYRRGNVQPSCGPCNKSRSDNAEWSYDGG